MSSVSKFVARWEEIVGVRLPFAPPAGARLEKGFVVALPPGVRPMRSQADCRSFFDLPVGSFQLGEWNGTWYLLHVAARERVYLRAGYGGMYTDTEAHRLRMRRVFATYLRLRARADVSRLAVLDSMGFADSRVWFADGSMQNSALLVDAWNERVWSKAPVPGTQQHDPSEAATIAQLLDARMELSALARRMNDLQPRSAHVRPGFGSSFLGEFALPSLLSGVTSAVGGSKLEWTFQLNDGQTAHGKVAFPSDQWIQSNSLKEREPSWVLALTARSRCWMSAGPTVFVDDLETGRRAAEFESLTSFFTTMVTRFGIEGWERGDAKALVQADQLREALSL